MASSTRSFPATFAGLLLAMLLASLDQTIVATALPTVVADLGGIDRLSWVVTAYLLTATVTIPLWGRAADVSEKTVFNYFPTKEDLVFWRLEAFEEEILGALRERAPGEPALAAFRRFVLTPRGLIDGHDPAAR